MNPFIAEALAALQAKGYSRDVAQSMINSFLARNPGDEHRLMEALVGTATTVTRAQLLSAAQSDSDLASRVYVQQWQEDAERRAIDSAMRQQQLAAIGAGAGVSANRGSSFSTLILLGALALGAYYFYTRG